LSLIFSPLWAVEEVAWSWQLGPKAPLLLCLIAAFSSAFFTHLINLEVIKGF